MRCRSRTRLRHSRATALIVGIVEPEPDRRSRLGCRRPRCGAGRPLRRGRTVGGGRVGRSVRRPGCANMALLRLLPLPLPLLLLLLQQLAPVARHLQRCLRRPRDDHGPSHARDRHRSDDADADDEDGRVTIRPRKRRRAPGCPTGDHRRPAAGRGADAFRTGPPTHTTGPLGRSCATPTDGSGCMRLHATAIGSSSLGDIGMSSSL